MKRTALYQCHLDIGAKMGAFAGYDMPLYYDLGVLKEHEWVRSKAGLFDVSHMGQIMIEGEGAQDFLETLTPSSYGKLGIDRTKYTVLTNEEGGIIDDLMVTRTGPESFHAVINAGCKDKDIEWIKRHLPDTLTFKYFDDWALLALQGVKAEAIVRDVMGIDLSDLNYMGLWAADDYSMFISRLGYTGEDGFEISMPNNKAPELWKKLCAHEDVQPIGLAARDSLRLEMGYALYGHDIDATTSPIEADLGWVMGKDNTGFFGAERILREKVEGVSRKKVGIELTEKGVAREGAEIKAKDGTVIGALTSGGFSPTLQKSIGQGYIAAEYLENGTELVVNVRGRDIAAKVVPMPFMAAKTKSAKKKAA